MNITNSTAPAGTWRRGRTKAVTVNVRPLEDRPIRLTLYSNVDTSHAATWFITNASGLASRNNPRPKAIIKR